jgi:hypothetical protein
MRARQVIHSSTVRRASQVAAALLVTAAAPRVSSALAIYNETSLPADVVTSSGHQATIPAGGSDGCAPYYSGCLSLDLPANGAAAVQIEAGTFTCAVQTTNWGRVHLRQEDRSALGLPPNYYCVSYDTNGNFIQTSNYGVGAASRNVHFLVTGDPQYDNSYNSNDPLPDLEKYALKVTADTTLTSMMSMLTSDFSIRGLLVAGDLTMNTRPNDELVMYEDALGGYARFVFDGLGNHDVEQPTFDQQLACTDAPGPIEQYYNDGCVDPLALQSFVRNRKRATSLTLLGRRNYDPTQFDLRVTPHYSWDWHDVHFVQLNVFPGNYPTTGASEGNGIDPMYSLEFLAHDLATNVGNSRRPVVLVHHYGFDGFSLQWWTDAQRAAYWNTIAPYNVVAIFSGHNHLGADSGYRFPFRRPASFTEGPALIPTFDAAAARNGAFVDVQMDQHTMTISRRDQAGALVPNRTETIFLDDGNVALEGAATQSSTDTVYSADRAIDGSVNGELTQGSVSRTGLELSPWWQVDFGIVRGIRDITLHSRTDSGGASLYQFDILVSNDGQSWQNVYGYASTVWTKLDVPMNVKARYVRVQLRNTGTARALNLAEVRVLTNSFGFSARHSGLYISVKDGDTYNGAGVVQLPYAAANSQRFEISGTGTYTKLVARHSGLCLGINNASTSDGAQLIQQNCMAGATHQEFSITEQSNGYVKLVAHNSGLCVAVRKGETNTGAVIIQEACQQNRSSQEFYKRPDP